MRIVVLCAVSVFALAACATGAQTTSKSDQATATSSGPSSTTAVASTTTAASTTAAAAGLDTTKFCDALTPDMFPASLGQASPMPEAQLDASVGAVANKAKSVSKKGFVYPKNNHVMCIMTDADRKEVDGLFPGGKFNPGNVGAAGVKLVEAKGVATGNAAFLKMGMTMGAVKADSKVLMFTANNQLAMLSFVAMDGGKADVVSDAAVVEAANKLLAAGPKQ